MPKTKAWYIISELNGYTLNLDEDGVLELCSRSKDTWVKHNWLRESIKKNDSEYDDDFMEGKKQASGQLKHAGTGYIPNTHPFCSDIIDQRRHNENIFF